MKRMLVIMICAAPLIACVPDVGGPDSCIFAYSVSPTPPRDLFNVAAGDSVALVARREPGCGGTYPVTWTVAPTTVATIRSTSDSTAMLRAVAAGNATVNVNNGSRTGFVIVGVTSP